MATTNPNPPPAIRSANGYASDSASEDGQAGGSRKQPLVQQGQFSSGLPGVPSTANLSQPAGTLLKGATDAEGNLKDAALLVGLKLDLEAEVHLTARIRGDITIGLY